MDIDKLLKTILRAFELGVLPKSGAVVALVQDTVARKLLLADPSLTAALAQCAALQSGVDCSNVCTDLHSFIDVEQANTFIPTSFRQLKLHLYQCPDCFEIYTLAKAVINAQKAGELPGWPRSRLSALSSPVPDPIYPPLTISRIEITRAFTMMQTPHLMRGASHIRSSLLLVADVSGQGEMFVDVALVSEPGVIEEDWQFLVTLSGPRVISKFLIRISCGNDARSQYTNKDGAAHFKDIPTWWIISNTAPTLSINIETLNS